MSENHGEVVGWFARINVSSHIGPERLGKDRRVVQLDIGPYIEGGIVKLTRAETRKLISLLKKAIGGDDAVR